MQDKEPTTSLSLPESLPQRLSHIRTLTQAFAITDSIHRKVQSTFIREDTTINAPDGQLLFGRENALEVHLRVGAVSKIIRDQINEVAGDHLPMNLFIYLIEKMERLNWYKLNIQQRHDFFWPRIMDKRQKVTNAICQAEAIRIQKMIKAGKVETATDLEYEVRRCLALDLSIETTDIEEFHRSKFGETDYFGRSSSSFA
ncbi:hypothetical protein JKY72_04510 [Candidatus Gracilibacteria bacterium]|nr:hypothetical protein [Candidatus Gracilibacteria bacterium]